MLTRRCALSWFKHKCTQKWEGGERVKDKQTDRDRERERETHTHTDTQAGRQAGRQTEKERERHTETDRQTDRQAGRQADRQTEKERYRGERQRERQRDRDNTKRISSHNLVTLKSSWCSHKLGIVSLCFLSEQIHV